VNILALDLEEVLWMRSLQVKERELARVASEFVNKSRCKVAAENGSQIIIRNLLLSVSNA
jgi:hypothetical protein